jgi:hypothetical protein
LLAPVFEDEEELIQLAVAHPQSPGSQWWLPMAGLREVFRRYYLILTHKGILTFEPVAQYNIYEPFRFALIADP